MPMISPYYYYTLEHEATNSSLDQVYQSGKIFVYCSDSQEGKPIATGKYCIPLNSVVQFEEFIDSLLTEVPMFVSFGDMQTCGDAAADLIRLEQLSDQLLDAEYVDHSNHTRSRRKVQNED